MLLDCTLRDGGFVNDWEFGYSSIRNIVSRLDKAGIEIIEVGFLDSRRAYDENRAVFPDTASVDKTLSGLSVKKAMLVGMIDFGACPAENIAPHDESVLDGIRVIFKKKDTDEALLFCESLKSKGYKIFCNPVSLTSYTNKEILELIEKINAVAPFAVSIVDTYGLMLREEILHYVDLIDNDLAEGIMLGYHSHNNQQMAYANCCAVLDRRNRHDVIVDATLFGMGKSAGNANIELVASYVNKVHSGVYETEQLLDCIYTDILRVYLHTPWGYNLQYYLSALNDCHPNYIKYLIDKNTLSVNGINKIIATIPKERKLAFSQTQIDKAYVDYQSVAVNDAETYEQLSQQLVNATILLIFPGDTIRVHHADIDAFIDRNSPAVISVNFLPSHFFVDYVFVGNSRRYDALLDSYHCLENSPKVIATSNILEATVPIKNVLNYESLLEPGLGTADNSAILCLNFLRKACVKRVYIAGMDGFSDDRAKNFADPFMTMYASAETAKTHNAEMRKYLMGIHSEIETVFLTPSMFDEKKG
jgi:4-hydroxy 2-oxovalerate aldolase